MKVYTTTDAREILRISKTRFFKLLKSGELEYFRIGKSIRITEEALQKYIVDKTITKV